jgi:hypothetical protein
MEGRRFIGCDIDPGCVETTRRRLQELTPTGSAEEIADHRPEGDASGTLTSDGLVREWIREQTLGST